nr:ATP-binding protein [uncultured Holophaga sp.]
MEQWILVVDETGHRSPGLQRCLEGMVWRAVRHPGEVPALLQTPLPRLILACPAGPAPALCRSLRELVGPNLPILCLLEKRDPAEGRASLEAGADDLLSPEDLPELLLARVQLLLHLAGLEADLAAERSSRATATERRERLARSIVHDLKTPIQGVLLTAELLEDQLRSGAPWEDLTAMIRESGRALARIAQDLLDLELSECQGLQPRMELVHLSDLLEGCRKELQGNLDRNAQHLHLRLPEDLAWPLDQDLLGRALLALLINASRHSPNGSAISLEVEQLPERLQLRILDQGPPIPDDARDQVFHPFNRPGDAPASHRVGNGLGLAFCRAAVECHGGTIRADNAPGGGAVFVIQLPWQELPQATWR